MPLVRYVIFRVAHAPGMPGTFTPPPLFSDPDMYHGTFLTHVSWCMPGSLASSFLLKLAAGKKFPAFPAHAQPAILRIWLVAYGLELILAMIAAYVCCTVSIEIPDKTMGAVKMISHSMNQPSSGPYMGHTARFNWTGDLPFSTSRGVNFSGNWDDLSRIIYL